MAATASRRVALRVRDGINSTIAARQQAAAGPTEEDMLLRSLSLAPTAISANSPEAAAPSDPRPARLVITGGPSADRALLLKSAVTSGSEKTCDIALPGLASQHARFLHRNGCCVVYSLAETPETQVNSRPVDWAVLQDGDLLTVGPYELRFASASD